MRGLELWKPMIAAVNGACLGGGLELALACDLRIASENATFGLPEVTLGLIPGWGGTQRLPRIVSPANAAELLLTGRPIVALDARRIGLVNKVVPPEELMSTAMQLAEILCRPAPLAVRAAKQAMIQGTSLSLDDGLKLEKTLTDFLVTTEDFNEGKIIKKEYSVAEVIQSVLDSMKTYESGNSEYGNRRFSNVLIEHDFGLPTKLASVIKLRAQQLANEKEHKKPDAEKDDKTKTVAVDL